LVRLWNFKAAEERADRGSMPRVLGLVSILVTLAVVAYLYVQSSNEAGPTSDLAVEAEEQASRVAAGASFQQAAFALEEQMATAGTYAGAVMPTGVALVRADAASYCLQAGAGATAQHLAGPGGSPAPGPC
jgi:hypothetical protein